MILDSPCGTGGCCVGIGGALGIWGACQATCGGCICGGGGGCHCGMAYGGTGDCGAGMAGGAVGTFGNARFEAIAEAPPAFPVPGTPGAALGTPCCRSRNWLALTTRVYSLGPEDIGGAAAASEALKSLVAAARPGPPALSPQSAGEGPRSAGSLPEITRVNSPCGFAGVADGESGC